MVINIKKILSISTKDQVEKLKNKYRLRYLIPCCEKYFKIFI